ncbi:MAG: type II secretion system F family protein [Limisphaerales bacterium]
MNYDEFAFLNQQLAAMLRDGIPLEGALRRLCADMRRGPLRSQLEQLEADLAKGTPLASALAARQLPDLYKRLLAVGARSNDLPGVLNLLADYYQRQHNLWTRLKGLMVYPAIVLFAAFFVSLVFYFVWTRVLETSWVDFIAGTFEGAALPAMTQAAMPLLANLWVFPTFFGSLFVLAVVFGCLPELRRAVRWRLPAFREASLANTASMIWLLLKGGIPLPETIGLVEHIESDGKARREIATWARNLSAGAARFSQVAAGGKVFPPLFVWLVSSAGEDLAAGFQHAAEIYQARAEHRSEILLYAALPLMVLALGVMILMQGWLMLSGLLVFIQLLDSVGG